MATPATGSYIREGKGSRRAGGDRRGSAASRRRRKQRLLDRFGNGFACPCAHCGRTLTYAEVESDRIIPDGPYRFDNVVPSCRSCNAQRGNNPQWQPT